MLFKAVRFSKTALVAQYLLTIVVLSIFWTSYAGSIHGLGVSTSRPLLNNGPDAASRPPPSAPVDPLLPISDAEADLIELASQFFVDYPLQKPYTKRFGELGGRLQVLRKWIEMSEKAGPGPQTDRVMAATEAVTASAFPFLVNNSTSTTPLADLSQRFTVPRGIVIPTGNKTFRFACHLIVGLRRVFKTTLPIQVVYAGNTDLPEEKRDALESLATFRTESGEVEHGDDSFLDATEVFDDATLKLAYGGWAIKAFAALASKFTEVILLDADAVFFQDPISLLQQKDYQKHGALFFHDRLLWQYDFKERHQWWHSQVIHEGLGRVVVVDKSRLDVVLGLLHVAWQNTKDVREETTYKMTYGDKEAWWFGFELANATYAFEKHYGGIVGWGRNNPQLTSTANANATLGQPDKVCSFVISHVDESDKLLWYNGGLLKNKITNKREFEVPTHWMMDAEWEKGASKPDMSCMKRGTAMELADVEKDIIKRSIKEAQIVDIELNLV
ncbi:hypothetical protein INS49_009206 [Diaporthe citri]|uniref:uncharacterized protein n=1 Tax=Diaporthe citri TaxID=83186 RepID=UPI001C7FAD9F|nr:uncharacterized protein INS49_009206 [Diaporthe citri]KAG6360987.1 hypothetical protein INS49_009206 [Diaporthe citri]